MDHRLGPMTKHRLQSEALRPCPQILLVFSNEMFILQAVLCPFMKAPSCLQGGHNAYLWFFGGGHLGSTNVYLQQEQDYIPVYFLI